MRKNILALQAFSLLIIILILELNVWKYFYRSSDALSAYDFGGFFSLALLLPFVVFVIRPIDKMLSARVMKNPLVLVLSPNNLDLYNLTGEKEEINISSDFSIAEHLIAEPENLEKSIALAFKELSLRGLRLKLSPYVIFTSDRKLTSLEIDTAKKCIARAGAVEANYIVSYTSDNELLDFVKANPVQGLFS